MKKILVVIVLATFIVLACKKGSNDFNSTITFLNAGIDMQPVTLNLNNNAVISSIAFDSIIYNHSVLSGTYALTLAATGFSFAKYAINTSFTAGSGYTAIVYDSTATTVSTATDSAKLYFQKDVFPTTITNGKCSLRFFDLLPDTGAHIFLKVDTGTAVVNGKYYFSGKKIGDFGTSNVFAEADTTTRWLKVIKDTTATLTKTLDSTSIGLKNGKIYTIYLTGVVGGTGAKKPRLIVQQHN